MKKALITGITGQDGSYLAEQHTFRQFVAEMVHSDVELLSRMSPAQDHLVMAAL